MIQIGNYTAEDIPIGSGGMGQVLKGYNHFGQTVAIKEILPIYVSNTEYRSRIESEINFLKKLNNDHVVKVYDHFEINGMLYIVMEYIDGLNIEQYVEKNGKIGWQDAVKYMVELLQTMQDVHEHGIVHRDIKPGNIMIRDNGKICLLDFGVAKDVSKNGANNGSGTVVGTIIGTDGYMSPEQASGLSIDHRSDIYALGCVLHFMLTGTHAFGNEKSELGMQRAISQGNFPRLNETVKGLPSSLQRVIDHAIDKNMMRRIQSCREFANELKSVMPGGTEINEPTKRENISVSIGRENCDICVGQENFKVSRHHGDFGIKEFPEGEFYIYTDCSSNGTVINGVRIGRETVYKFGKEDNPTILLAGESDCAVNLQEVKRLLETRKKEVSKELKGKNKGKTQDLQKCNTEHFSKSGNGVSSDTFIGAVVTCFKKYIDFKGRASRSEFWWFILFYNIVISIGVLISIIAQLPLDGLLIIYSVIYVIFLLPCLAVMVRRFHDIDKSGKQLWFLFIGFIPIIGTLALLFFAVRWLIYLTRPSDPDTNRFGPPPGESKEKKSDEMFENKNRLSTKF